MNLTIDIGNTCSKIGIFNDTDQLITTENFTSLNVNHLQRICDEYNNIKNSIIASVSTINQDMVRFLKINCKNFIQLNASVPLPIKNEYESKETLGLDRIANVAGVRYFFQNKNVLVFDVGTAMTIDFITKNNEYLGGNISPGLEMRFKALHNFTHALPLLEQSESYEFFGKNTQEAIISGVQQGIIYEIEGYIRSFHNKYSQIQNIITGGNADFFEKKLNYPIFAVKNLSLFGLNRILQYNVA